MVQNRGNATAYVAGGGHRPLPTATGTYRAAHAPQPKKPTGLDWDALTPRCTACGEKSGQLDNTDTCPTCRGVIAAPSKKATTTSGYQQLSDDDVARRFGAPTDLPPHDGTRLGRDLAELEAADPTVAAAAAALDDTTRRTAHPDDHVVPEHLVVTAEPTHEEEPAGHPTRAELEDEVQHVQRAEQLPETPEEKTPAHDARVGAAAGPQDPTLAAELEHAARVLRDTAASTDPVVRLLRLNAFSAIESLHLYTALNPSALKTAAPVTSTPAGAAPRSPEPATPGHGGGRPAARPQGEGGARPARRRTSTTRTGAIQVDEQAVLREYAAGDSKPTIATRHGVRPKRIRDILERHGVELRDDRAKNGGAGRIQLTSELADQLRQLYVDQGLSIADVTERLNHHHRRVTTRLLHEAGIEIRPAAHESGTVLTADQEQSIVDRYVAGEAMHELAREHHIRSQTVRDLVTAAGHTVRAKGASSRNAEAVASLGVTAAEIRGWAVAEGLIQPGTSGLVPIRLIEAYAAAHPTTASTGDTAA